jgi:hypothetical protein
MIWVCQNKKCNHQFYSWEAVEKYKCPKCKTEHRSVKALYGLHNLIMSEATRLSNKFDLKDKK